MQNLDFNMPSIEEIEAIERQAHVMRAKAVSNVFSGLFASIAALSRSIVALFAGPRHA